jgi:two-component system chemotaxis sensor kinase CheA
MSVGVDLSQFFDTFFDEADELLADMERLLLGLDLGQPDPDDLNGIFRAAHSIKGGAGTFGCFEALAQTTHLLENILDQVRRGDMALRKEMIDLFLETKDVLAEQVAAYRNSQDPDEHAYARICAQLRELAQAGQGVASQPAASPAQPASVAPASGAALAAPASRPTSTLRVDLAGVGEADAQSLLSEMALLGTVLRHEQTANGVSIWMASSESADDITAVCCFVVNADQVKVSEERAVAPVSAREEQVPGLEGVTPANDPAPVPEAPRESRPADGPVHEERRSGSDRRRSSADPTARKESGTIRVGVEKVDQIINLVGELVITQAMLVQAGDGLDPVLHDRLLNGIEQLERNARDLQEAVMSIRMMPMDYVFSRFPRVVRENASRLGKQIRLVTEGEATELDKSLIERIIDPLTHLVRNSLDHGIETPDVRVARGKDPEGCIMLSAQHNGGQIVIEVSDDGAGLDRRRILAKAASQGMAVSDNASDEEVWQLIFAPGFSTAEKVTDISGRGVGMDVVRRNIQGMGGHIHLSSREGVGTTMRIALPLTLAILDGMSVRVGNETFILPLSHVTESMQPTADQIHLISEDERVMHVRGEYLPMVALHEVFAVEGAQTDPTCAIAVILQAEETRFALLVDQLVGQHQVVVKNLESNYRKIPGVSAATILGDGSVALIVDVFALVRMTREVA